MDKSMLADLDSLPEADKQRMTVMIDQLQIRDSTIVSNLCVCSFYEAHIVKFPLKPAQHLNVASGRFGNNILLKEKPSLRMYNSLVERCFSDCVDTFKHKSLQKQEETCVRRCAEKFLKHSMRVGMRFAELNQGAATQD
ncbi:Mitochondrial import inner membrane translocase subunit Tim9 [Glycine max]|nr:Mitochondrial import inner membrane translocase subunit Tim9 [Glycine max]